MREIKFKGKRIIENDWIEGSLVHIEDNRYSVIPAMSEMDGKAISMFEVQQDTICQCTGVLDNNDKMIYEGDILHLPERPMFHSQIMGALTYMKGCFIIFSRAGNMWNLDSCVDSGAIIIGNKFDNPELIKWNTWAK